MSAQQLYARISLQPLTTRSYAWLSHLGGWFAARSRSGGRPRKLQVAERVALGDKTAVSILHVDGRRFLVASTPSSVDLLTELASEESFDAVMQSVKLDETEGPRATKTRAPRTSRKAATT